MAIRLLQTTLLLLSSLCLPLFVSAEGKGSIEAQVQQIRQGLLTKGPRFSMTGTITNGVDTMYRINGEDFVVGKDALIIGNLAHGRVGTVRGSIVGGKMIAEKILVSQAPSRRSASVESVEIEPEEISPQD